MSEPMAAWIEQLELLVTALRELANEANYDLECLWCPLTPIASKYSSTWDLAQQTLKVTGFDLVAPSSVPPPDAVVNPSWYSASISRDDLDEAIGRAEVEW